MSEAYKIRAKELTILAEKNKKRLSNVEDYYLRGNIAALVENQIKYNFKVGTKMPDFIKQVSIPASIHILMGLPSFFGLQTGFSDIEDIRYHLGIAGDATSIQGVPYKPLTQPSIFVKDIEIDVDPQEIAYQGVEVAITMCDDIVKYAVEDIMSTASIQFNATVSNVLKNPLDLIQEADKYIRDKIGRASNFVVLPVTFAKMIKNEIRTEYDFDALPINIKRIGCLKNKWMVYINGHVGDKFLVGYRGTNPIDVGYLYTPSLLFCDPKKEQIGTAKERIIMSKKSRYHLVNPDYFACMQLTDDKTDSSTLEF